MLDFLRNLTRSTEEKEQEMLNAYVDDALSSGERARFEARLRDDRALQAEVASIRRLKGRLNALPKMRAPRSFALDPAVYGKPTSPAVFQLYPFARAATVLTAFFLVVTVALGVFTTQADRDSIAALAPAEPAIAMTQVVQSEAEFAADEGAAESLSMTQADVAEEIVEEESADDMAEEDSDLSLFAVDPEAEPASEQEADMAEAPVAADEAITGVVPALTEPLVGTLAPTATAEIDVVVPRDAFTATPAANTRSDGQLLATPAPAATAVAGLANPAEDLPPPPADTAARTASGTTTRLAIALAALFALLLPLTLILRSRL